jgi:hypothetical protein
MERVGRMSQGEERMAREERMQREEQVEQVIEKRREEAVSQEKVQS